MKFLSPVVWEADLAARAWRTVHEQLEVLTDIAIYRQEGWAVAGSGAMAVMDDVGWHAVSRIGGSYSIYCVSASLDGQAVTAGDAVGDVYELRSGQQLTNTGDLVGVAMRDADHGLAVGDQSMLEYDQGRWRTVPRGDPLYAELNGVSAHGGDYLGVTGDGQVMRHNGVSWDVLGQPTDAPLYEIEVTPDGAIWAMGTSQRLGNPWRTVIVRFSDGEWSTLWDLAGSWGEQLTSLGAINADEAWAAGRGGAWHYYGGTWSHFPTPPLFELAVVDRNEVWAAAEQRAAFYRWDGTSWAEAFSSPRGGWIRAMAAASDGTVWAGGDGVVWHHSRRGGWRMVLDPQKAIDTREGSTRIILYDFAFVGEGLSQSVIAVGANDTILHGSWVVGGRLFLPRLAQ